MPQRARPHHLMQSRRAGVLLHPTSLPGGAQTSGNGGGDIGPEAYRFVDFLAEAGFSMWQMLPTGPTHANGSPYQTLSAHAGSPGLISLDGLVERHWLTATERDELAPASARAQAAERFFEECGQNPQLAADYNGFCQYHQEWLDDYALFQALRDDCRQQSWNQWPEPLRLRDPEALSEAHDRLRESVQLRCFEQFVFFRQWQVLRDYARQKHIYLFGDMPIFVAQDSADVWANQALFNLDEKGDCLTIAGVPPDCFSETGQHWGNPHYDWERMQTDGFYWWRQRLASQLELFDLIRLDHFRGLEAFWEIPADRPDPRHGRWVKAPGEALLNSLLQDHKSIPLIAENLGLITPEVEALREQFELPGMVVLQFAFDGTAANPHLPHKHTQQNVVYTGTHDNDTSLGWFESLPDELKAQVYRYSFNSSLPMPDMFVQTALASVANLAIIPLQDLLGLDNEHRMNMPGTELGNWAWRFEWDWFPENLVQELRESLALYQRLANED